MILSERIAREAHHGQKERWSADDTKSDYIEHLKRVVEHVKELGPEAIDTAWLHDVLEDTPMTAIELLDAGIEPRVVRAVQLLTRGNETYAEYIDLIRGRKDALAVVVKIADLRDHLRPETLTKLPELLKRRYARALERLI